MHMESPCTPGAHNTFHPFESIDHDTPASEPTPSESKDDGVEYIPRAESDARVAEEKQEAAMANDCMAMIHDHLKMRLGEDMKGTPPMMYPEAIDHAIALHRDKAVREEREACAALVGQMVNAPSRLRACVRVLSNAAAAIRARGADTEKEKP